MLEDVTQLMFEDVTQSSRMLEDVTHFAEMRRMPDFRTLHARTRARGHPCTHTHIHTHTSKHTTHAPVCVRER